MGRKTLLKLALAAAGAALALPALADTKAGVDAWTAGDFAGAIKLWETEAAKGDADALFNLGQAYKLGKGVKQDLTKAEALYGQAAALGHIQASDVYGLLLFQRGERTKALPYIRAAADRGDPRAQYLAGIAHFNGDLLPKDWVRAYALVSLARQQGLPQAAAALAQMDLHVPMEQRQQAVVLAAELASQADATRARQLAAADLGSQVPAAPPVDVPAAAAPVPPPPPVLARTSDPVDAARRVAGSDSPATAGADYARPAAAAPPRPAQPRPAPAIATSPSPAPVKAPPAAEASGPWRVQLGAFGVAANADAMWNRVKGRPELAGSRRLDVRAGAVTKLQAGGFASEAAARAACGRLSTAGFSCLAVKG